MPDGAIVKNMASGEMVFNSGPGITTSTGSKQMNMSSVDTSSMHQSLGAEKSVMDTKQTEFSRLSQETMRKSADLVARIAEGEASGKHYNYGNSTSDTKQLVDAVAKTKELHENYGYSYQQAAGVSLSGGGTLGYGKGGGSGNGSSWGLNLGLSGKLDASKNSEQRVSDQKGANLKEEAINNIDSVARASKDIQYNTNQSEEKSLSDSLSGSYEKMKSLRESISVSQQNIERYQSSIDHSNAQSFSVSDEMYHKELKFIAGQKDQYGFRYSMSDAQRLIEKGGGEYNEMHKEFMAKHIPTANMPNNYISLGNKYGEGVKQINDHNPIGEESIGKITRSAHDTLKEHPVDKQAIARVDNQFVDKNERIDNAKSSIMEKGRSMQGEVNELEKNRLGKGIIKLGRHKKDDDDSFNNE